MTIEVLANHPQIPSLHNAAQLYEQWKQMLLAGSSVAAKLFRWLDYTPTSHVVGVLIVDNSAGVGADFYPPGTPGVPNECTGGMVVVNVGTPLQVFVGNDPPQTLPIEVSLAHELGHAEQYDSKPQIFMSLFQEAHANDNTLVERKPEGPTGSRKRDTQSRIAQLRIENDNIVSWERPICHQLGFPQRIDYESDAGRWHFGPAGSEIKWS